MEALDYWRLCENLTVIQAALLFIGLDPAKTQENIEMSHLVNRPVGYDAVKTAITDAITTGGLIAKKVAMEKGFEAGELDLNRTTVAVTDLANFLRERGCVSSFFIPAREARPDYLVPGGDCYSPKLAAAVEAWKAVSSAPELRKGTSVKQAIIVWLRQHASEYGLTKDDGKLNEMAITEIAKISNWDMKGGAPKTPSST